MSDEWGPPGGERSCGTQLSEMGKRGGDQRGRMDISHALANCAPACYAAWPAT